MSEEQKTKKPQQGRSRRSEHYDPGKKARTSVVILLLLIPVVVILVIMAIRSQRPDQPEFHETIAVTEEMETHLLVEDEKETVAESIVLSQEETTSAVASREFLPETPEEITALFQTYFKAKQDADAAACDSCFTGTVMGNPDAEQEKLLQMQQYIEEYQDITCHVLPASKDDDMIVYVSYKIRFFRSEVAAPSLSVAYVTRDGNGAYKIYDGPMEDIRSCMEETETYDSVRSLIREVQDSFAAAVEQDAQLAELLSIVTAVPTEETAESADTVSETKEQE